MLDKVDKSDYRFVPVDADDDFSPEHNNYVIEKTIREYEETRKAKHNQAVEAARERASALAVFIKGVDSGRSTSNPLKFFGKKELARLRGNEVRDRLDQLRVLSKDGKLMRKVQ